MKRFSLVTWWVVLLVVAGCSKGDDDDSPNPSAGNGVAAVGGGGAAANGGTTAPGGVGGNVAPGGGAGGASGGAGGATAGAGGNAPGGAGGNGGAGGAPEGGAGGTTPPPPSSGASVLQYHKNSNRDGLYVDAAFTRTAAAGLKKAYSVAIAGPTYAQPLFVENGAMGKDIVIVATERNEVSALDAADGAVVWRKTLGAPATSTGCFLSNINPLGITGTPVVDLATKRLFLNAVTSTGGFKHQIFALSLEDGSTVAGWPVDVAAKVKAGSLEFEADIHNQRGALIILDGKVYVPYGGHFGDCGNYHGWVVGVPIDNPAAPIAWATRARAGGIWAPGGIASDGTSLFVATGNTMEENSPMLFSAPTMWGHGESIIKLPPSLQFSDKDTDFASAMNWSSLDTADLDIGGCGPVLLNVPGATPSSLVLGLGKDSKAYLANTQNLGGMGKWVLSKTISSQQLITAAVAYNTPTGSFFAFKGMGSGCPGGMSGQITAVKVGAASPPTMDVTWCAGSAGDGSAIVTSTDGTAETIVWHVASDRKLRGFNGETGAVIFSGGGAMEQMGTVNKFQTPIAAKGKIFVAAGSELFAFTL
ncbi:MAG TPA: PQQ-binding-like beta-propeller repeat protein [Polyangiales bacterium]|nr:PQQ-binding-like beta-propeller repeat protein [Polyangiales bacterium]